MPVKVSGGRLELTLCWALLIVTAASIYRQAALLSAEFDGGRFGGWLPGLQPGWFRGRKQDLSDPQWRNFRAGAPLLVGVAAVTSLVASLLRRWSTSSHQGFWLLAGIAYAAHLHGACLMFILGWAVLNFALVKGLAGRSLLPLALWTFNCAVLVANRHYSGYSFAKISPELAWLDSHRGVLRWHIGFNMVSLRMLSFGLDCHWAALKRPSPTKWPEHNRSCLVCKGGGQCYHARQETSLDWSCYSLWHYITYLLYPPLFLAGPTISYNAFVSQVYVPQTSMSRRAVALYGLRLAGAWLLMELLSHTCYFNSMATSGVWERLHFSMGDTCSIGYGVINFIWLKFLIIWRFFRLWALLDGIEPPENMLRCVNNNYDIEGFWKSWHASYNRWLVRYLYIPLGGARWRVLNVWVIFTFVALWHDLEWKLLSWAWITCLLCVPELAAKAYFRRPQMKAFRQTRLYRELCAVGATANMMGMMAANMVGFVIGLPALRRFLSMLLSRQNIPQLLLIIVCFYAAAKVMFALRGWEEPKLTGKEGSSAGLESLAKPAEAFREQKTQVLPEKQE